MNSRRVYLLTVALFAILCIGVLATTFLSLRMLNSASKKLVETKLQNRLLDEQQSALNEANKLAAKYATLDKIARTVVPQDKDQAKAVRDIVKIADESNIKLGVISFPPSTLGALKPKTSTTTGNSSQPSTPSTVKAPAETQVKPVAGIPGVYVMEIRIIQNEKFPTTYAQLINFLQRLENNRRTAQVSEVSIEPLTDNRKLLDFNLVVNVYIKP